MTLRAASCFSGIGAPEVAMPNWQWLWCAEIEKFPSAVMAARHPQSVNLGDVTADDFMQRASSFGQIDVLCAGSPCQSFSVAGLRKGMDDPRGNLTLRLLAIVDAIKPKCLIWENVPGILSDKSDAFGQFLDALEELGYIYDTDILDAQWFGLAQRRRRVFVCAHRLEDILQKKTITSALIVIQLLTEFLLLTLVEARPSLTIDLESLVFNATEPKRSLQKRIRQFGMDSQPERVSQLAAILDATLPLSERVPFDWVWGDGSAHLNRTEDIRSSQSTIRTERPGEFQNTERSWLTILDALSLTVRECITSTAKNPITESRIFGSAQMIVLITEHITPLMASHPSFWSAASSTLTAMKVFTDYARQATSDLFADPKFIRLWSDFIGQAEQAENAIGNITVECFDEILPVSQSMCWNPPSRRGTGKDVAGTIAARTKGGGGLGTDFDLDGGLVSDTLEASAGRSRGAGTPTSILCADVAPTLDSHFGDKMGLENQHINGGGDCSLPSVAMCLNAGAMQRLDPTFETLIPTNRCDFDDAASTQYGELAGTLTSRHDSSPCADRGQNIVADPVSVFDPNQITSKTNRSQPTPELAHTLPATSNAPVAYRTSGNCGAWETGDKTDALTTSTDPNSHVIAFSSKDSGNDATEDMSPTLRSMSHADSHANGGGQVAVAFALRGRDDGAQVEISGDRTNALRAAEGGSSRDYVAHAIQAGALRENPNSGPDGVGVQSDVAYTIEARSEVQAVQTNWSVRRLTPVECARLQGFPDDFLDITYRGKEAADGPKYKALGNSWAVPVGRYIMERIERFMP